MPRGQRHAHSGSASLPDHVKLADRLGILKDLKDDTVGKLKARCFTEEKCASAVRILEELLVEVKDGAELEDVMLSFKAKIIAADACNEMNKMNCFDLLKELDTTLVKHFELYRYFLTCRREIKLEVASCAVVRPLQSPELTRKATQQRTLDAIAVIEEDFQRKKMDVIEETAKERDQALARALLTDDRGSTPMTQPLGRKDESELAAMTLKPDRAFGQNPEKTDAGMRQSIAVSEIVQDIVENTVNVHCDLTGAQVKELVSLAILEAEKDVEVAIVTPRE
ncbi:uncharacterized protein LOC135810027 [Sycon ciliatum]|uniref:uncharacterized protein LOC135810027 n=1 Tax=Sycon ciliatum TaxID=27933 RepID=UPI0020A8D90C|eukprot:scpid71720/ scgid25820/ 